MKRFVLAILIVFLAIGITFFVRLSIPESNSRDLDNELIGSGSVVSPNVVVSAEDGKISLSELAKHNVKADCWVGYGGKVYDVTSFLPRHPGSAGAISPYCGTSDEFTRAFTKQHGTSKVSNLMKVGTLIGDFQIKGSV